MIPSMFHKFSGNEVVWVILSNGLNVQLSNAFKAQLCRGWRWAQVMKYEIATNVYAYCISLTNHVHKLLSKYCRGPFTQCIDYWRLIWVILKRDMNKDEENKNMICLAGISSWGECPRQVARSGRRQSSREEYISHLEKYETIKTYIEFTWRKLLIKSCRVYVGIA